MPPGYIRIGPQEAAVLMGEEAAAAVAAGPDSGLLLESDTGGTDFLLLETGDFLLLEG